ncbi:MAG: mandelate racemase/muconate lactonizing enzyme family protein [Chloroflexi bacterium]|nr:mandelate racemase/muconate lactonizing enzyme family protein [Chloroflexota bacterium]MCY4248350.1 mandelate racemase/muconate lactonizing enzyme family protein [Chloroflexota bacterium]
MRITQVEAIPVRIKRQAAYLGAVPKHADERAYFLRPPYRALYSRHLETAFVKIITDDGAFGWGEALAPVAPEVVCAIIEQLLAPALLRRNPLDGNVLWNVMYDLMRERGYYGGFMLDAISACDMALWDLRGKSLGQPVYQLLGGAFRERVPCYVSGLPRPTPEERVDLALDYVEAGFNAFKLAAGHGLRADAASVKALRDALGDDALLLLDAHWVYALDDAIQLGQALAGLGVGFFEAPINPEDIQAHAQLAAAVAVPIAHGETERTRYQFRPWLEQNAAQILQPDVGRAGISEVIKIASMAEAFNTRVAPHLSVGLGICIAATLHAAAAIPNLYLLEYQPPVFAAANLLLESPLSCAAGFYDLPTGAGLGVALDERTLRDLQA